MGKTVLQKIIAESGYCSRRKAEELIRRGKVTVNGNPAELGMRASGKDDVRISGKRVGLHKSRIYIKLNKPAGYTCTNRKFQGEKNVFDLVTSSRPSPYKGGGEAVRERLFVAGRLDKGSRGLILLTNDGDLAQRLTHPRFEHEKTYIVETRNSASSRADEIVKKLQGGVEIGNGDGVARAKSVKYLRSNILEVVLTEGKKRQIRRMLKAVGCEVVDLARIGIGNLKLDDLREGEWKFLSEKETKKIT